MSEAVSHSMLRRAVESELVDFRTVNPREFTKDKHRTVDDKPFGGGPGMLMKPGPVADAIRSLEQDEDSAVIFTDPTGMIFNQEAARSLVQYKSITFVCGHYEGIDERVRAKFATHTYSIGDYVLTGGELPALVMSDAVVRLVPGVLGDSESLEIDSHSDGLLSAPQFTRPEVWEGEAVPDVCRSGDHRALELWKRQKSLEFTRLHRPDLFCRSRLAKSDLDLLSF